MDVIGGTKVTSAPPGASRTGARLYVRLWLSRTVRVFPSERARVGASQ